MPRYLALVALAGLFGAAAPLISSAATVEHQLVGPLVADAKYVVSLRGARLATVAAKGSRVNVIVDGVAGPRFDEIVQTGGAVDWRPYIGIDPNSDQIPRGAPVTFSKDGNRYAYLARLGQEWVLMADNKELLRIPVAGAVGAISGVAGSEGNHDIRLEFSGENGKHLLFSRSTYGGYELWVDGQKWPGFYVSAGQGDEASDPIISPDGEHIAYVAQMTREKRALIVDGRDAGYFGEHLQFTRDSKHLICIKRDATPQVVLMDGKPLVTAMNVQKVYLPPMGNRLVLILSRMGKDGRPETFLQVDGKAVEATVTSGSSIKKVVISPDGKHCAALCGDAPRMFVVIDGKKGQEYFSISDTPIDQYLPALAFAPDSSRVGYTATMHMRGAGQFVVINDEESDGIGNPWFRFSADGKHLAYGGMGNQQKELLVIDGKTVPLPERVSVWGLTFSPDGSRYAFQVGRGGQVFVDGQKLGVGGEFAFSPDSKHLAVVSQGSLTVDGQTIVQGETFVSIRHQAFTPDSQHLIWMTEEPAIGAKAAPGAYEYVVYVDGAPLTRCDARRTEVASLTRANIVSWKATPYWNVDSAGALVFLGPLDGEVKRITVTPPPDTNIETMIAKAKGGGAKGKTIAGSAVGPVAPTGRGGVQQLPPTAATAARTATGVGSNTPTTPAGTPATPATATPDPVADAAALAKKKVDSAAAKTKSFLESLTKKK